MAEMLERQPIDVQSMLLRTSVADRLNGELADRLAGRPGCEQVLLALEDANALVISLDASRTWFRYHQLLADFLRLELRRRRRRRSLTCTEGAAWFADQGRSSRRFGTRCRGRRLARCRPAPGGPLVQPDPRRSGSQHRRVIAVVPCRASVEHPELALAHAATQLAQGRLEDNIGSAGGGRIRGERTACPPRRLAIANASLRLALARRSGQFAAVVEQVKDLDTSTAEGSSDLIGMDAPSCTPSP